MRFVASLLALTLAVGCGSDATTAANVSVEGTWNLLSINGAPLPFNLGTLPDGTKLEVVSQSVILAGGKYTSATAFRSTTSSGQTTSANEADAGTYSQSGATVTFVSSSDASVGTATVSGNRFTTHDGGVTLVFEKR
jgi:hypothetical protein